MITAQSTHQEPFIKSVEDLFAQNAPHPFRAKAFKKLFEQGLPSKKSEAFTYVPLRQLYQNSYSTSALEIPTFETVQKYILKECSESVLVFVDGNFIKELSRVKNIPSSVAILQSSIAEKGTYSSFIQRKNAQSLEDEQDPFALINMSLSNSGAFVFVPPKLNVENPVQLLFLTSKDAVASFPKVNIALGSSSFASFISSYAHLDGLEGFFQSALIDISLDESAACNHSVFMDQPSKSWNLFALRATLKKDAKIDCKNLSCGSKGARQDYRFTLLGEGSDSSISGLTWLDNNNQSHVNVLVDHKAPGCTSNQFFKGVLADAAQSSFTGKILVRKEAQKTQAYQLNNNLLLTEGAIANSKPGLEILADDVKASHGATVSQLDDEQMFYLKTRGLSSEMAKGLLVLGFCRDILDKLPCESLRENTVQIIERYLQKQNS